MIRKDVRGSYRKMKTIPGDGRDNMGAPEVSQVFYLLPCGLAAWVWTIHGAVHL